MYRIPNFAKLLFCHFLNTLRQILLFVLILEKASNKKTTFANTLSAIPETQTGMVKYIYTPTVNIL